MQTLVIVVHPNLEQSIVNKRLLEALDKFPEKYKIHNLYAEYPDEKLDVKREQDLVESYERVVFQFPIYWFSSPSLLKKWLDQVLTYNWAYGRKSGYKLGSKKVAIVISAGIDQESATENYALEKLILPFELTFDYIKATYKGFFAFYGVDSKAVASDNGTFALERTVDNVTIAGVEEKVGDYLAFINSL